MEEETSSSTSTASTISSASSVTIYSSEDSSDTVGEMLRHKGPVLLPGVGGISILSFTPAFSFSIIPAPIPVPNPRPASEGSNIRLPPASKVTPPVIFGKPQPKKNNKIAEMSRKIQKKIIKSNVHISRFVKKLDPIKETDKKTDDKSKPKTSESKIKPTVVEPKKSVTTQTEDRMENNVDQPAQPVTEPGSLQGQVPGASVLFSRASEIVYSIEVNSPVRETESVLIRVHDIN